MKSTTIKGLASLCALAMPFTASADGHNSFDLYGTVEVRTISRDASDLDTQVSTARIGLKGVNALPNSSDMKVRWQMEFDIPKNSIATGSNDTGDVGVRKANLSLQGGFGELILGRQNNLGSSSKKIDTFKNDSGAYILSPYRLGNAIGYVTPSMGGAKFFVQIASDADAETSGDGVDVDASVIGLEYSNDSISATLAKFAIDESNPSGETDLTTFGLSTSFGSVGVFGTYQDESITDQQVFGLGASYSSNDWTYKLGMLSFDKGSDNTEGSVTHLLAQRSFGNGVSAFVQYADYDSSAEAAGKGDAISVGIAASASRSWKY